MSAGAPSARGGLLRSLDARTDPEVLSLLGAALFALGAWPLLLTEIPPMQDLPNHLATIHVVEHPERYPELVFNGHFKTNGALFAWLHLVGRVTGAALGARLFAAMTCAASAFVLPRAVYELTGSRSRAIAASLFAWPMVHNWFVSMGMLDFALAVPLSLLVLVLFERHRQRPRLATGLGIAAASVLTWYAHAFALLAAHLLLLVHLIQVGRASPSRAFAEARRLVPPLLPSTVLVLWSLLLHASEPRGEMAGHMDLGRSLPAWELLYNAWAEWLWGFTNLELSSFVPALCLGYFAWRGRGDDVPFFSPLALAVLGLFYVFTPYSATNWFHVNSRFLAYLWLAALLRVPERLPRGLALLAALSGILYSAGMGIDYLRLEADRRAFVAGMGAVPEGARLLPLVFRAKRTSVNSRSLLHAWGFYVVGKSTSAPLLFAHSRSFPVMYREPPPDRWNHLVLEGFAPAMRDAEGMCSFLHANNLRPDDCSREYKERWAEFWAAATPRFDHVLLWEPTPQALAEIPPAYRVVFERDGLSILERAPR